MKKRLMSVIMVLAMLVPALMYVLPVQVFAAGRCKECGEWNEDDYCPICYRCENCVDICSDCGACNECATELGGHCPECEVSCIDPDYGNVPHCENCYKCENCATLHETMDGVKCEECIEEAGENEYNIMCPHCETNIIGSTYDEDDPMDDNLAPCGEHCQECYDEFVCPECNECTLCEDVDLCDTCEICLNCAVDGGYHCGYCDDGCYAVVGKCPDDGDHCKNCCEDICENCNKCTVGAGVDYCDTCHLCEDCWEHCEVCEACFEDVEQCGDGGDHCSDCCQMEDWLCAQCERCTEALDLDICEYCGLCEECCEKNRKHYGTDRCVLDESAHTEDIDPSLHDKDHHLLRYTSSSDECHDVWCAYPGCDYYLSDCTPHEFKWKVTVKPTYSQTGLKEGECIWCHGEVSEVLPKLPVNEYYFIVGPKDQKTTKLMDYVSIPIQIGVVGKTGEGTEHARIAAFPWNEGEALPETWKELRENVYEFSCENKGLGGNEDGSCFAVIHSKSNASLAYGGKYCDFEAKGTKLTWRLAIYDGRGSGEGKVCYSDPFEIDWNAEHKKHEMVMTWGKVDPKKPGAMIIGSKNKKGFNDGTYHWMVCKLCGYTEGVANGHEYTLVSEDANCLRTIEHYICKQCGHTYKRKTDGDGGAHIWTEDYKIQGDLHYKECTVCGTTGQWDDHDYMTKTTVTCEKTIRITVCKLCAYAHLEHDYGKGHSYTGDGNFNGWYGNSTKHWKICTSCGFVNEADHNFVGGACSVCGYDIPQMGIVGDLCVHGGQLHIEMISSIAPDDAAKFNAGNYTVYWYDEFTGDKVGYGKTFPLDEGDVGHQYRAEVSITGGDDYNAYMYGAITSSYVNVTGYPATCATEGLRDHKVCLGCGRKFIGYEETTNVIIPKTNNHTYTNDCDRYCDVCGAERNITHKWSDKYKYDENTHYKECTVCGAKSESEPHDFTMELKKEANCNEAGLLHKKCVCGYDKDVEIPAHEHKLEPVEEVAATCMMEGLKAHYYCGGCGQRANDEAGKETVGINKLLTPKDPDNHVGGEKLGYNEKVHYTVCECGAFINEAEHTFDKNGRCTVCYYRKGSKVSAGGKVLERHKTVFPTCIAEGVKKHYTDAEGRIYLSKAGVKEVSADALVIPKSKLRHVGGEWGHTDSEHWIDCACGAKIRTAAHKFEAGKCTVCGFIGTGGSFPWWIVIVIGAAALSAGATFLILFFIKKKKKEEEEKAAPEGDETPASETEKTEKNE